MWYICMWRLGDNIFSVPLPALFLKLESLFWKLKNLRDKFIGQSCIPVSHISGNLQLSQSAAVVFFHPGCSPVLFLVLFHGGRLHQVAARRKFFDSDNLAAFAWCSVWRVSFVVLSKPPYLRNAYCLARRAELDRSFPPSGSVLHSTDWEGNTTNLQIFSRLILIPPRPASLSLSLTSN